MNHVLSVGEIYDKAIDLCLRNAGKIVLTLGAFCMATLVLGGLSMSFRDDRLWTVMHVRPREPILHGEWLSVLENLVWFGLFPVIRAALTVLFDRTLHGRTVGLRECFKSPLRRTANVIVASFLLDVASFAAIIVMWAPAFLAFIGITRLVILGPIVGLSCVLIWLTAPLMIGVATGFAQVALDAGRVMPSLRSGIAYAYARATRRRALGIAVPLIFIFAVGTIGGFYAAAKALGLTDNIAAYVIVSSAGEVVAYGLLTAIATVYYRNQARAI